MFFAPQINGFLMQFKLGLLFFYSVSQRNKVQIATSFLLYRSSELLSSRTTELLNY
jgi:hypothetical protein